MNVGKEISRFDTRQLNDEIRMNMGSESELIFHLFQKEKNLNSFPLKLLFLNQSGTRIMQRAVPYVVKLMEFL